MHMKIFKRNQIIISVIALMLITVGYMNYSSNIFGTKETSAQAIDGTETAGIGDAKLVNSNSSDETKNENINKSNTENNTESNAVESSISDTGIDTDDNSKAVSSSSTTIPTNSYFVSSRIERDNMYSEMIETYEKLLSNETISGEQKASSTKEISNINNKKNSIMIAENLIKNLGFEDVVVFFNENSVSVIVKAENLKEADVAQIQNIVCRELGVKAEVVHISVR